MEKRIELEKRGRKANQITELNLDNCRSTSIVGLTDEYTALESLSLINVGLTTLKGFPKLPDLKKLELSDNRISNGLHYLHTSPKLQCLNLCGNKLKDLEAIKPLEEFKHLTILDLFNNDITYIENYRSKIFEMIPSLKFLDGFDCNDAEAPSEADDDEENGNYSEDNDESGEEEESSDYLYSDGENVSLSLSEIYNEDLEEDDGEWDEENAEDNEEDNDDFDEESEEDEANDVIAANANKASEGDGNAEEHQARGKKRKHDG